MTKSAYLWGKIAKLAVITSRFLTISLQIYFKSDREWQKRGNANSGLIAVHKNESIRVKILENPGKFFKNRRFIG